MQAKPLAARLRPSRIEEYVGQQHLLAPGKPLYQAIENGHLYSMILWGPAGTGKTTLAHLLANSVGAEVVNLSAVLAGVKDIRDTVAKAEQYQAMGKATILFIDEIHRFNKAQQDALLPHVETGTVTLIGATTENPSFQLNNALLSRARVYVLQSLTQAELQQVLERALTDVENGLANNLQLTEHQQMWLIQAADGDARQLLGLLELLADFSEAGQVSDETIVELLKQSVRQFDHHGEHFYDQISALHKSVRGTDPDAALYWFARMLDGGCDPAYLARRILRMASEDIGNADPRALTLALDAWQAYERLGSPEGDLALAQAVVYMACAPKSNATYLALAAAQGDVKAHGSLPVPVHLRNAPTKLMKELGYGKAYQYPHDFPNAYVPNEQYVPEGMPKPNYYQPVERGLELKIREKLQSLKAQ